MKVEPHQLIDIAKNVLIQMGIHDYEDVELTWVMKAGNEWRVNFSFKRELSAFKTVAAFAVNAV